MGQKKLGAGFWIVMLVAVVMDTTDILTQLLGAIFSFSVVLAPLGALVHVLASGADIVFAFIIGTYLLMGGVRPSAKNAATIIISMAIELVPVLGLLPMETVMLFIIRHYHNKEVRKAAKKQAPFGANINNEVLAGA